MNMGHTKKPRVLCVDDEPSVLRALGWLLRSRFEVSSTTDTQEALSLLRQNAFEVVISDQRMPGMTGTEFLERAREVSPRSIRLLLTGYSDFNAVLKAGLDAPQAVVGNSNGAVNFSDSHVNTTTIQGGGERIGELLGRRSACFLQMIGADIHRVPLWNFQVTPAHHIRDQPQRRGGAALHRRMPAVARLQRR